MSGMTISPSTLTLTALAAMLTACDTIPISAHGSGPGFRFGYDSHQRTPYYRGRIANSSAAPRSPNAPSQQPPGAPPTHKALIRELLVDCQNQLMRNMGPIPVPENGRAMRALGDLCGDSTLSQRTAVRKALHLMVDDDFIERVKQRGGIAALVPAIRVAAIAKEPSLADNSCLLSVIDEVVYELLTNPFGL